MKEAIVIFMPQGHGLMWLKHLLENYEGVGVISAWILDTVPNDLSKVIF